MPEEKLPARHEMSIEKDGQGIDNSGSRGNKIEPPCSTQDEQKTASNRCESLTGPMEGKKSSLACPHNRSLTSDVRESGTIYGPGVS